MNYHNYIKKGKLRFFYIKFSDLKFGIIGLKAMQSGIINLKQLEYYKKLIIKGMNYKIKIWDRKLFYFIVTKKPVGIRMGKGSGKISFLVFKINYGDIILEFSGLKLSSLLTTIESSKYKLPLKTKVVISNG